MLIRTKLALNLAAQIALVAITAAAFAHLVMVYRNLDEAQTRRFVSYKLAEELEDSSNSLTLMARLFIVTQDVRQADYFRQIWRIREGLAPRPAGYDSAFWDLQLDKPGEPGEAPAPGQSLIERMRAAGFTAAELALLEDAKKRSDTLAGLEEQAMGMVDMRGSTQPLSQEEWRQALDLVHGERYRHAKAEIMAPIRQLRKMVDARLEAERQDLQRQVDLASLAAAVALLLLAINVITAAINFERSVRRPVLALLRWAQGVRAGRHGGRTRLADSSEFGELSVVIDEMAESVEHNLGELKEEVARRTRAEQVVRHLANHDALTGLPSLRLLHDRLERALAQAQRQGQGLAVIFADLNKFKPVNDRYGHEAGDLVLKTVAQRLAGGLREADTVGRIGGDEFLIILPEVGTMEAAQQVRDKLLALIDQPIYLTRHNAAVTVTAAMGIALYPSMASDAQALLRLADQDMYRHKEAQRRGD
ncbi:GGDEF domain-containing protein [Paucibacter sp. APW11]|uniref:GGDEF domain-containing protein n=1 Tax=Roseateles aquae TaxID=3077235 RepID=A0ABU3PBP1_9BURK|nr:GGDEF domain-containing protein [Paucibacter sp. APW11]MDT8999950.1 GGDEF domain-containing protein [Paucibacter sp. APW11]